MSVRPDAIQWTGSSAAIWRWLREAEYGAAYTYDHTRGLVITTPAGQVDVKHGRWIVRRDDGLHVEDGKCQG